MIPAAWHPDPTGKHELRYWDGGRWTEHVADAGVQGTDPLEAPGAEVQEEQDQSAAQQQAEGQVEEPEQPAADQTRVAPVAQPEAEQPWAQEAAPQQPTPQQPMPQQPPIAQQPGGTPYGGGPAGISGELIDGRYAEATSSEPGPLRQNDRMLRVRIAEPFMAKQGAMVAYQGNVQFSYQGSGAGKFLKKAVTGEGLSLMRVDGPGDCFLADRAKKVHILHLANSGISINGQNVLAFSTSLDWDVERVKGGSMAAGGLFNTTLRGSGWVVITTDGDPVVLDTGEAPTFADTDAIVAWSADLQTSINSSMSAGAVIGRGSGEAIQVQFNGPGFAIVQPAEGGAVPPHSH